ncbi:head GIN domain-containing protein [Hymenobacter sp. PAMC 26628]|uniref:head GIN domain-containing protein n=1 Tax=Hymenobacter sp. PAMC 26628 TaxID=1484118 RepID=UPI0009EA0B0C|nr:head GIN domain-containing protein [Hymenobacter sp. PAMC 26628]
MRTSSLTRFFDTAVAVALALTATGAIAQQRQARPVSGSFEQVESSGGIDVYLSQGPVAAVAVEALPEALPHVVTEVRNGTLSIHWEKDFSWQKMFSWNSLSGRQRSVKVYITAPRLTGLALSGGADAHGQTPLVADEFSIRASGGSDVTLRLQAKTVRAESSGGSDVTLTGKVERQDMRFSGGSDYHGLGLQSTTATINASGGSDADVWVDGELTANTSGGSDLRYKGNGRLTNPRRNDGDDVKHVR